MKKSVFFLLSSIVTCIFVNCGGIDNFILSGSGSNKSQVIVFTEDKNICDYDWQIWLMTVDGNNKWKITDAGDSCRHNCGTISPDGSKIVFYSNRPHGDAASRKYELFVADADGRNLRQLTYLNRATSGPCWSPDGDKIIFTSEFESSHAEVYVINIDGSGLCRLTDSEFTKAYPVYSPDGRKIIYHGFIHAGLAQIFIMNSDGSDLRQLTFEPYDHVNAKFSPEGDRIIYSSAENGDTNLDVFEMATDGSAGKNLTADSLNSDNSASYSPNGESIVYYSMDNNVGSNIWIMNRDGSNKRRITGSDTFKMSTNWQKIKTEYLQKAYK